MAEENQWMFGRLAHVIEALHREQRERTGGKPLGGDFWFHTGLFDMLIPDSVIVIGETEASKQDGAKRRREHVVPRLVVASRCMAMLDEGKTREDVACFLQTFLKIVFVSLQEAREIDAPSRAQKKDMPPGSGEWWNNPESIYVRLENAGIPRDRILPIKPE